MGEGGETEGWLLLADLDDSARRAFLARAVRRRFRRGETLFHEGDPGDTLHLLAKGRVVVRVSTPLGDVAALVVLGPGQSFGEVALVFPVLGELRPSSPWRSSRPSASQPEISLSRR